jgi:signal transduction histidine kinase
VEANGESVRSALLNLVLNALEAMPRGGRLTMALRPEGPGHVLLEVADTGEGIPQEEQERVFEFAYTTRENGNGLGLAIVHHCIVEEHGGRVSLDSRPGAGTRVRVTLPVRGEAAA